MEQESLKFPIGKCQIPEVITSDALQNAIIDIRTLPQRVEDALNRLSEHKWDIPYRPNGWTVRQVVHHLADSHMNALMRLKLALTESNPSIKPYLEAAWAELPDYRLDPQVSLGLLRGIHSHWSALLTSLSESQWKRTFFHPENQQTTSLMTHTLLYQWHGNHHLAHLNLLHNPRHIY
ncbi:MAG: putative metal-dependent hydrolase [Lunatimonas sp.]|uniref:YfiT family bacillithiol transferase n=1 Tax=Lunatimonas sp. TaxID=2060141 RepID=UPI00263A9D2B|nr:putative metal-dependent hydrolase [Lunatimonas sp.]MCC5936910.1 putative metal-dependent hydrolase [Lunatimonas sp.]